MKKRITHLPAPRLRQTGSTKRARLALLPKVDLPPGEKLPPTLKLQRTSRRTSKTILRRLPTLKFDVKGLIPAIVQDVKSGDVLMIAYMNKESLEVTLKEGRTCFYSRSRQELWRKGDTSGHIQKIKEICYDCDADALLVKVEQTGVACHTGAWSCFYRKI